MLLPATDPYTLAEPAIDHMFQLGAWYKLTSDGVSRDKSVTRVLDADTVVPAGKVHRCLLMLVVEEPASVEIVHEAAAKGGLHAKVLLAVSSSCSVMLAPDLGGSTTCINGCGADADGSDCRCLWSSFVVVGCATALPYRSASNAKSADDPAP